MNNARAASAVTNNTERWCPRGGFRRRKQSLSRQSRQSDSVFDIKLHWPPKTYTALLMVLHEVLHIRRFDHERPDVTE